MSAGGVQLLQQGWKVAQALCSGRMLEALVLGKDVDEAIAGVVAVTAEQVSPTVAQRRQHIFDLGLGTELRHSASAVAKALAKAVMTLLVAVGVAAAARPSSGEPGVRATARARRWARRPGS